MLGIESRGGVEMERTNISSVMVADRQARMARQAEVRRVGKLARRRSVANVREMRRGGEVPSLACPWVAPA
jgi:hypothetical protein